MRWRRRTTAELLAAHADGGLSPAEAARVEAHLAEHPDARAELAETADALAAIRAAEDRPGDEPDWDAMARAIQRSCADGGPTARPDRARGRAGAVRWAAVLASAAAAAAGVIALSRLDRGGDDPRAAAESPSTADASRESRAPGEPTRPERTAARTSMDDPTDDRDEVEGAWVAELLGEEFLGEEFLGGDLLGGDLLGGDLLARELVGDEFVRDVLGDPPSAVRRAIEQAAEEAAEVGAPDGAFLADLLRATPIAIAAGPTDDDRPRPDDAEGREPEAAPEDRPDDRARNRDVSPGASGPASRDGSRGLGVSALLDDALDDDRPGIDPFRSDDVLLDRLADELPDEAIEAIDRFLAGVQAG